MAEQMTPAAGTAIRRRFDPRYLAVAFGVVFAWSEVSQAWKDWGLAGQIFTYTGFIPLQLTSAWALVRAARVSFKDTCLSHNGVNSPAISPHSASPFTPPRTYQRLNTSERSQNWV